MTSTTAQMMADDGLGLLVRRWERAQPRARMLIVHGLGEHSGRWEHVGDFFANREIDVTAFDLRGHGASGGDRVDINSFDEYLDDVEVVFDEIPNDGWCYRRLVRDQSANSAEPVHLVRSGAACCSSGAGAAGGKGDQPGTSWIPYGEFDQGGAAIPRHQGR